MKQIKIRPGVVLLSVCDEHLLVATREARDAVPYVQQINGAAAYYWKLLEENMELKIIIDKAAQHFNMPKINALVAVNTFINKLKDAGYIIFEDQEETR